MADNRSPMPIEITEADLKASIRHTLVYDPERGKWRKRRPMIDMVWSAIHHLRTNSWPSVRKP
jgi:hypothetical protein